MGENLAWQLSCLEYGAIIRHRGYQHTSLLDQKANFAYFHAHRLAEMSVTRIANVQQ